MTPTEDDRSTLDSEQDAAAIKAGRKVLAFSVFILIATAAWVGKSLVALNGSAGWFLIAGCVLLTIPAGFAGAATARRLRARAAGGPRPRRGPWLPLALAIAPATAIVLSQSIGRSGAANNAALGIFLILFFAFYIGLFFGFQGKALIPRKGRP